MGLFFRKNKTKTETNKHKIKERKVYGSSCACVHPIQNHIALTEVFLLITPTKQRQMVQEIVINSLSAQHNQTLYLLSSSSHSKQLLGPYCVPGMVLGAGTQKGR